MHLADFMREHPYLDDLLTEAGIHLAHAFGAFEMLIELTEDISVATGPFLRVHIRTPLTKSETQVCYAGFEKAFWKSHSDEAKRRLLFVVDCGVTPDT